MGRLKNRWGREDEAREERVDADRRRDLRRLGLASLTAGGAAAALKLGVDPAYLWPDSGLSQLRASPALSNQTLSVPALTADPLGVTGGNLWWRSDTGELSWYDGTESSFVRANEWGSLYGKPWVTVNPTGRLTGGYKKNNGSDYGVDTAGTSTQGWAEAVAGALSSAAATKTYATAQVLMVGPGSFTVANTIPVSPPSGAMQYYIGLRVLGTGINSQIVFTGGTGFTFSGTYAFNNNEFKDIGLTIGNTGSATSAVSAPNGENGNVGPMLFTNVQLQQDNTLTPSASLLYFPEFSGFICYFVNSVLATGFNMTLGQDAYFRNCLLGGDSIPINIASNMRFSLTGGYLASPIVAATNTGGSGVLKLNDVDLNLTSAVAISYVLDGSGMANNSRIVVKDCDTLFYTLSNSALVNLGTKYLSVQWSGGLLYSSAYSSNFALATGGAGSALVPPSYFSNVFLSLQSASQYQGLGVNFSALSGPSSVNANTYYQNTNNVPVEVELPVTFNPTSSTESEAGISITDTVGGNSQQVELISFPAGSQAVAGFVYIFKFTVPQGGQWELLTTVASTLTIGTPVYHQARDIDH